MGTDAWGIDDRYEDALHSVREAPRQTIETIRRSMGAAEGTSAGPPPPCVRVVRRDDLGAWHQPGELTLEDGAVMTIDDRLPPDLPFGYHIFRPRRDGQDIRLIATPGECILPKDSRAWGWAIQLYGARSHQSWGMGDLSDLRRLAEWSAAQGASVMLVNPLAAAAPVLPQEASPYYPTSRQFKNPLYLRVEEIPSASDAGVDVDSLASLGRALNRADRIDRSAVYRLKIEALGRIWTRFSHDDRFDAYCAEQGAPLDQFARFCVLAEQHGRDWRTWPAPLRHPASPAVAAMVHQLENRRRFHQWLQWRLDEQLAQASRAVALVQDLPVGVDAGGADAWAWQDVMAQGISVGAPPDIYNTLGQNWGLPPFIPHKLQAACYEPFIRTIRACLRHAGGLRIDHAMGLFRLFWIPDGSHPREGTYVRYPYEDLLGIIALESYRQGAFIVGEDLGTVEPLVHQQLALARILSYRVLWFEEKPPATYSPLALAAVTTHDLPTVAGLWTGSDFKHQQALGLNPTAEATDKIRERLRAMTGLRPQSSVEQVIEKTYALLAETPAMVVTATLEDALVVEDRPNMPGTTDTWPNWSIPLPKTIEELKEEELPQRIAGALRLRSQRQGADDLSSDAPVAGMESASNRYTTRAVSRGYRAAPRVLARASIHRIRRSKIMAVRTSEAVWEGDLKKGHGTMKVGQNAYEGPYSFASRFENGKGTNPEELLAAAHAGCFSMAFSAALEKAGHIPKRVHTTAKVSLEKVVDGFAISKVELQTDASVPGIDEEKFQQVAETAKMTCPVSKLFASAEITLNAKLAK